MNLYLNIVVKLYLRMKQIGEAKFMTSICAVSFSISIMVSPFAIITPSVFTTSVSGDFSIIMSLFIFRLCC